VILEIDGGAHLDSLEIYGVVVVGVVVVGVIHRLLAQHMDLWYYIFL
jgi:hypothetical protein